MKLFEVLWTEQRTYEVWGIVEAETKEEAKKLVEEQGFEVVTYQGDDHMDTIERSEFEVGEDVG